MSPAYLTYSPYAVEELEVLLHNWHELRDSSSSFVQVRMMDVSRCFKRLEWMERHCLYLRAVCKMTSREAGSLLGISHTHALSNYTAGKEHLLAAMNGQPCES